MTITEPSQGDCHSILKDIAFGMWTCPNYFVNTSWTTYYNAFLLLAHSSDVRINIFHILVKKKMEIVHVSLNIVHFRKSSHIMSPFCHLKRHYFIRLMRIDAILILLQCQLRWKIFLLYLSIILHYITFIHHWMRQIFANFECWN